MKDVINMKSVIGLRRPWLKQMQNAHRKRTHQWKDQIKRRFIPGAAVSERVKRIETCKLYKNILNILHTCDKLLPGELPSRTLPWSCTTFATTTICCTTWHPKLHYQLNESEMSLPGHFALSFRVQLRVRPQRWYVCPVFRCWIGVADISAEC